MFRKTIPVAVFVLCFVFLACGKGDENYYYNSITVEGVGSADAEPEIARVIFGVDITGEDPAEVVNEAAQLINDAMAAAREEGVEGEDMQTTFYNLWVEEVYDPYEYVYTGELEYHISHMIRADIRDMNNVGNVLAAVVSSGANTVNSVSFTMENPSVLMNEARKNAVDDARQRAEILAENLNVELGEVVSVSEYNYGYYGDYYDATGAYCNYGGGLGGQVSAPSVTPGAFSVSTSVTVAFRIE